MALSFQLDQIRLACGDSGIPTNMHLILLWRSSPESWGVLGCTYIDNASSEDIHPWKLTHYIGKSPFSIGNTSSNGGCSIVMLVFGWYSLCFKPPKSKVAPLPSVDLPPAKTSSPPEICCGMLPRMHGWSKGQYPRDPITLSEDEQGVSNHLRNA